MAQGQGTRAITFNQFLFLVKVHLLQHGEAWIIHITHPQAFNLSLDMGMVLTKGAIMRPIAQQGLCMGAKMTLILPMVNKVTPIPGNGNKDTLPLGQETSTLLACIQLLVPRRPISQILFQPPVHHHCSQRVDKQDQRGLPLVHPHYALKMNWST